MASERLDKILSEAAGCSRKEAAAYIRGGKVTVGGKTVRDPSARIDPGSDELCLNGQVKKLIRNVVYMLNKPEGILTATEDPSEKTVLDLIRPEDRPKSLFPAGRLDKDVTGLVLLTDDGTYCHRVISPRSRIYKTYEALVEGQPDENDIQAVRKGLILSDGEACLPGLLTVLKSGPRSLCQLMICEGKYHQVKRMMASFGKPVLQLRRTAIGGLVLDPALSQGEYRALDLTERELVFKGSDPFDDRTS